MYWFFLKKDDALQLTVYLIYHPAVADQEAVYLVKCPQFNHLSSCGDTEEEAVSNFKDALALALEPLPSFDVGAKLLKIAV